MSMTISAGSTEGHVVSKLEFLDSGGIKFGYNAHSITAGPVPVSFLELGRFESANSVLLVSSAPNLSLQRFHVPAQISATQLNVLGHYTVAASTAGSMSLYAAIYTIDGSSANRASSASSAVSHSSGGDSTNVAGYSAQSGTQWRSLALGTWNLTPGEYLLGLMASQNGPAGTTGSHTFYGKSAVSVVGAGLFGVANRLNYFDGGVFSTGTASPPASIHISDVNRTGSYALAQPGVRLLGSF